MLFPSLSFSKILLYEYLIRIRNLFPFELACVDVYYKRARDENHREIEAVWRTGGGFPWTLDRPERSLHRGDCGAHQETRHR